MALTSPEQIMANARSPVYFSKVATPTLVVGRPHSLFYLDGYPPAAPAPSSGIRGETVTSYAGQLRFDNPPSGKQTYLAAISAKSTSPGTLIVCDRIWHNSGISVTSTAVQNVLSTNFNRDISNSYNGVGLKVALEVSTATGSGTPTITAVCGGAGTDMNYSCTNIIITSASSPIGAFYEINWQGAMTGVKWIDSVQLSASWTSGAVHLVAYRHLGEIQLLTPNVLETVDAYTLGMVNLWTNTVPFLVFVPLSTTAAQISGSITYAIG